jgi:hypothetical protein
MRILIDTNIFIGRENDHVLSDELHNTHFAHPITFQYITHRRFPSDGFRSVLLQVPQCWAGWIFGFQAGRGSFLVRSESAGGKAILKLLTTEPSLICNFVSI